MKLTLRKIEQDLNNAYLKQSLKRDQIETFKTNLKRMFSRIDAKESEENLKNIISDFLIDTYYKNQYEINTKGRTDLVIHNGKSASDTVGVIIETKKPTNKAEMISPSHTNAKALHELLHYYMQERYINDNKEIKHIIATNINEWYIFDASDFERFFFENKRLRKSYDDWNKGLLVGSNTDWFYDQVARPFIEKGLEELNCTYFNLFDYQDIVNKTDKEEDEKLINLYKILSPEHLLKKPFANDSNTLNREFYNELLHIIGLEERPEKGKKLIYRKKDEHREDGSFLENALNKIKVRGKLERIENLEQYGENEEEQMYSVALELCITWLNRILFLKLLEGQLIKYHNGNPDYAFINSRVIQDFDELAELFFEVLALKPEDRSRSVTQKFGNIPYLNSSLFEISDLEKRTVQITALKDRLKLSVYNHTVLKDSNGKRISGEKNTLQYLFEFLDAYDFASESSATIQEENKNIINSSVLGLIFEKINGYKDGSFFTPGFITMYMSRETIRKAVAEKFKELENPDIENFEDVKAFCTPYFKPQDILRFNKHIDSLKICDPAVGSGHFLVSALNEIIAIKSDLNILANTEGIPLEYSVTVDNDELTILQQRTNIPFEYHLGHDGRPPVHLQIVQETLFYEKQKIIENCLFGVDINPKSVLICRLRLWIELLKNTFYKPDNYIELETLPNIDINIKCGNSLISRFNLDADISQALRKSKWNIETYRLAVQSYREAPSPEVKKEMKQLIDSIKNDFQTEIGRNDPKIKRLQKMEGEFYDSYMANRLIDVELTDKQKAAQDKKRKKQQETIDKLKAEIEDIKNNKIFINAFEWRFEFPEVLDEQGNFIGFDVVIGNPPYIRQEEFSIIKPFLKQRYKIYNSIADLLTYFVELSNDILKENGVFQFIISNKFTRANYGKQMRNFLLERKITHFIDFSGLPVFDEATVDAAVLGFINTNPIRPELIYANIQKDDFIITEFDSYLTEVKQYYSQNNLTENTWAFESPEVLRIKQKVEAQGIQLKDWNITINYGIKTGFNKAFIIENDLKEKLAGLNKENSKIFRPMLRGRDIAKYLPNYKNLWLINSHNGVKEMSIPHVDIPNNYLDIYEYLTNYKNELKARSDQGEHWTNLRNCAYLLDFDKPKIIYPNMTKYLPFVIDLDEHFYHNDKSFHIVGEFIYWLGAFLNSKLFKYCFKDNFAELLGGTRELRKVFIEIIPVKQITKEQEKPFKIIVSKILATKKEDINADTSSQEKEIDQMVYELYGLTEEEIRIVENKI
jgi:type II restriction/modification system DNA methylase subunit YeeA